MPGPGSLDRLIAERSGLRGVLVAPFLRLPEATRRTLTTAALLAERLSPTLLAAAAGKPVPEVTDDIAAGIRAGVLLHGPTGLSFVHALVRDAVVAHATGDERAQADAAIATAMEETGDDLLIGPSAVHWDRAGGPAASARCRDRARLAAARAATARAHEEAVHFARMSLRHARALGASTEDLAERMIELARYEWLANLVPDAMASCVEAVDLAEECGRGDLMAQAALVPQGIGSIDVSRVVDGLCRRALELLPADDLEARAGLLSQRAVAAAEEAADSSADGLSAAALDLARQSRSTNAELEAIAARHFVLSYPQTIDQRIPLAERAVELGRTSTTAMGALWGHLWQAEIALQLGDLAGMDTSIADIGRTARHRSSPVGRWHELRLLAMRAAMLGSFDEARAHAQDSLGIAERVGDGSMVGMHFAFRQQLAYIRGDPDEVPDVMDALAHAPPIPLVQVSLALAQCLTGQLEAAAATFEALRGMPDQMPLGPRWAATVSQIAIVAVLLDDAEVAERCYRLLSPIAHWCGADGGGAPFSHGSNEYPSGSWRKRTATSRWRRAISSGQSKPTYDSVLGPTSPSPGWARLSAWPRNQGWPDPSRPGSWPTPRPPNFAGWTCRDPWRRPSDLLAALPHRFPARTHPTGAGGRPARGPGPDQPADRRPPLPLGPHRRVPCARRAHQTPAHHPHRARTLGPPASRWSGDLTCSQRRKEPTPRDGRIRV